MLGAKFGHTGGCAPHDVSALTDELARLVLKKAARTANAQDQHAPTPTAGHVVPSEGAAQVDADVEVHPVHELQQSVAVKKNTEQGPLEDITASVSNKPCIQPELLAVGTARLNNWEQLLCQTVTRARNIIPKLLPSRQKAAMETIQRALRSAVDGIEHGLILSGFIDAAAQRDFFQTGEGGRVQRRTIGHVKKRKEYCQQAAQGSWETGRGVTGC